MIKIVLSFFFKKVYNNKGKTITYQIMKNKSIFVKTKSSILLIMLTFFLTSFTNNKPSNISNILISDFNLTSSTNLVNQEAELGVNITAYAYGGGASPALPATNATPLARTPEAADNTQYLINYAWGEWIVAGTTNRVNHIIVKYSATFTPPRTGEYRFLANADDGTMIYINGTRLNRLNNAGSNWIDKGSGGNIEVYNATTTDPVEFVLWFYENGGGAAVSLSWNYNPSNNTLGAAANILTPKTYFTKSAPTSKLTFVADGQTISPYIGNIGSAIPQLPTPIKADHSFLGWYTDVARTISFNQTNFPSARETILYAKFFQTNKTITLNQQGGSGGSSSAYLTFNEALQPNLNPPTRYGFTFDGYYANTNGSNPKGQLFYNSDMVSQTTFTNETLSEIYAHWTAKSFNVDLNPAPGIGGTTAINPIFNQPMISGTAPTRVGYTFDGYYATNEQGVEKRYYQLGANNTMTSANNWDIDGSPDLYAKWIAKQNDLTFNPNGGALTQNTTKTIVYDSPFGALPTPSFNGYSFLGWTKTVNGTDYISADELVNFEVSTQVFAKWQALPYNVTLISDNNTHSAREVIYKSNYGELPVLTKTGYVFGGWYLESNHISLVTASSIVNQFVNHSLFAKWTPVRSQVNFNVESVAGAVAPAPINVDYNSTYGTLPTLSKTGYNFTGWFTSLVGGQQINSNTTVSIVSPQTIYPRFSAKEFTLSFSLDGGTLTGPQSVLIAYDQNYNNLPTPTKAGYQFDGWHTNSIQDSPVINTDKFTQISNQTLYAHWTAKSFNVDLNPAPGIGGTTAINPIFNQPMISGTAPTRVGYTFDGYYATNEQGVEKRYYQLGANNTMTSANNWDIDGSPDLYAKWIAKQNDLTFNPNGGALTQNTTKTIVYDSPFGALPTPSFNGYSFLGWTKTVNGTDYISADELVNFEVSTQVFAKWQALPYNVTLISDNNTHSAREVIYKSNYGELPVLTKTGYVFGGWYLESNHISLVTASSIVNQFVNHSLFAKWTPVRSQVNFNVESVAGAVAPAPINVDYNSTYGTLPTLSKTGYNFTGWFTSLVGGQQINSNTTVSIVSPQTIYPRFSAKEFTLSFSLDGGTLTGPQSVLIAYDQNYNNLPTPTKAGYQFDGWHTLANNGTEVSSDSIFVLLENQTLFAYWSPEPYAVTFNKNDPLASEPTLNQVVTNIIDVSFNDQYGQLPLVSKLGYNFNGWFSASTGGQQITSSTVNNIVGPHSLFAQFTPMSFNVTYNHNFTGSPSNVVVNNTYDSTYLGMPSVTRTGYDFVGWFTSSSGGAQVNVSDTVKILSDTVYFARWQIRKFTLTFDTKGGNIIAPITGDFASQISIIPPIREGYVFAGWSPSLPTTMPAENLKHDAFWQIENYTFEFFINDGSNNLYQRLNANFNVSLIPLLNPIPIREGFSFEGWSEDASSDGSLTYAVPSVMPDLGDNGQIKQLYAAWKPIEFSINIVGLLKPSASNPTIYTIETPDITLDSSFEEPGYKFIGYFENEAYSVGPITTIPQGSFGDKNLFAKFDKLPFNIIFKDNLGNTISEEIVLFDDAIRVAIIPKIEIPGFEFVKWNPEIPTTMPAEDLELQAELKAIKYKLTIKNSLGSVIVDEEVEFDQSLASFSADPKDIDGYEFLEWSAEIPQTMPAKDLNIIANYKKIPTFKLTVLGTQDQILIEVELRQGQTVTNVNLPNLSNSRDFNFEGWDGVVPNVMPGQNITIKPLGSKKMNTIALYSKDRTLLNRIEAQVGSPLEVASPERIGYTFAGWSTSSEELIDISLMPVDPYDLFATWNAKVYTVNVSVASLDYQIDIEFDKPIGQIVTPQLFGYRFDGWKNNLTDEFVNSNTIFTSPDQINLVPVFTRLNAAETLIATPGFIINLIARILR